MIVSVQGGHTCGESVARSICYSTSIGINRCSLSDKRHFETVRHSHLLSNETATAQRHLAPLHCLMPVLSLCIPMSHIRILVNRCRFEVVV